MQYRHNLIAIFLLIALVGLAILSIELINPPKALPADAPVTEFSAERAMQHVQEVARQPHAMGTAAHAQARAYIVNELRQLGIETEVQEATVTNNSQAGYVYNVLGRIRGNGNGKAVMLMAHYDSQPNTPGAGDDAAGVAAVLETARALLQGETLQNDVILLLTDGEEYGLYGAKAFLQHSWAKEVGLVINVEARGNKGPSMTFEISPENGWVVEQFAQAAPYPLASSLTYEVYRNMPNDTDFTVFRNEGYSGVNSAFVDGFVHYHKMTDSPENLSRSSLQHHGSNMLALAKHFGSMSLNNTKAADKVFFNPAGYWLVQYPTWLNIVWFALLVVLLLAVLVVGRNKQALTIGQSMGSLFIYLLMVAITVGLFYPINTLTSSFLRYWHGFNGVYSADNFFIAYLLLALGLFLLLTWLALRWVRFFSLVMGVYLLWFVLTVAVLLLVPAAVYIVLFPLLFSLAGTLLMFLMDEHAQDVVGWRYALVQLVFLLPALFIVMPVVHLLFVIFTLQLPVATIALFVLLLGLFLPLLIVLERSFCWRMVPLLPLLLLLAGGLQIARAVNQEEPSAQRPLHSHVSYYLNADTGEALWVSAFQLTDDWNVQFFPSPTTGPITEIYPMATRTYLKNEADSIGVESPVAEILHDSIANGERMLQLRLHSPRGAAHLEMVLEPIGGDTLLAVAANSEPLMLKPIQTAEGEKLYFTRWHGLPVSKEVTLQVRLPQGAGLRLLLYDQSIGLPQQLVKQPMPLHVIPEQGRESNLTVVRKQYTF